MDLTGMQIFKYLPGGKKTQDANCKKCAQQTCMAYALKLAKQAVSIDDCPHIPEELKTIFLNSIKKQQIEISFGSNNQTKIGGETVMFRHEKTFVNKTAIAFELSSNDKDFYAKAKRLKDYALERVGEKFAVETIYLIDKGDVENKAKILSDKGFSLIIETENPKGTEKFHPIFVTTSADFEKSSNIVVSGENVKELGEKTSKALQEGFSNITANLKTEAKSAGSIIEELTQIRRLAMLEKADNYAFPVMVRMEERDLYKNLSLASLFLCRYANILVFKDFDEAFLTTLLTLRQNIYTDPQKPLQVEPKVYEINEPDENSLVFLTTNFALTYFAVANEIEALDKPAYLVVTASDGMSVLTAWSADKFTSELVAKTLEESDLKNKVKNRQIIIPGLLSHMKDELLEALPEWEILVGPNEAFKLPDFIKSINIKEKIL